LPLPAASDVTGNLLNNNNWTGNTEWCSGSDCWGGLSGGANPSFNGSTFRWGHGGGVINQTIAINDALKGSGIEVDGFRYHWHIKNYNANTQFGSRQDPFVVSVYVYKANGDLYRSYEFDYSYSIPNWAHFGGDVYFPDSGLDPSFFGNINLSAEGDDAGYWAGHYGPEFYPINFNLIYSTNPCANNPLYDPSCEGYAEAYAKQQYDLNCQANPLYDSGCPGYATAYYNQQCNVNPLYDAGCPGYAEAYYNQQCTLDALYDTGCPGYEQAYFNQQCSLDPFYDTTCPGYAQAYFDQQCGLDSLYDSDCPGYEEAYYTKYIAPQLEQQANEAAGVSTNSSVATTDTTALVEDPIAALVEPSATGDSTVDSVLKETTNVSTNIGVAGVDTSSPAPEPSVQETTTESAQSEDSAETESAGEMEELVALEEGGSNEESTESSDNVDESSEESESDGDAESGESDSGDDTKNESKSKSESKKSKKDKEKSKREKLKELATQRAMALADTMSNAASLEAQQAVQAQIAALINFVPGFNQYGQLGIPGVPFYPVEEIYQDKKIPENQKGLRNGLAQQLLHEKMVDMQYEKEEQ